MNDLTKKQIHKDYSEILSTDAGKRVFGGIFFAAKLNQIGARNEYYQGIRDLGLIIANTIREVDPHLIADCETAYNDFIERNESNERTEYKRGTAADLINAD